MTIPEQQQFLDQMQWTPIIKIQKDINYIKNLIASYMTYNHNTKKSDWKWDPDFDEGESDETRSAEEMWRIRQEAIKNGIPPPEGWAK